LLRGRYHSVHMPGEWDVYSRYVTLVNECVAHTNCYIEQCAGKGIDKFAQMVKWLNAKSAGIQLQVFVRFDLQMKTHYSCIVSLIPWLRTLTI
jgi:hypothetical protein